MAKIFVSYNRQSEPIVQSLATDIESLGHTVWFDHELSGGQAWWEQILETVRDCSVFVFVLSPEGLNSTACQREYTYAAQLGKPVLPVLVSDGVSIKLLPPALSKIEFVDYRKQDRDAVIRLARALSTVPPAGPLPDPLPKLPDAPISYLGSLTEQVDSAATLSYQDQSTLLMDLKSSLRDPKDAEDTRTLLKQFRKRRDLFATIAEDIDELLRSSETPIVRSVAEDTPAVSAQPPNVYEAQPSDPSVSMRKGNLSTLDHNTVPEGQKSEASAHELTIRERMKGAGIGAIAGLVAANIPQLTGYGYFAPREAEVVFLLSGAIAGAISGTNLTRLLVAAMGMFVALIYCRFIQFYKEESWTWFLIYSTASPLGAIVGVLLARSRQNN